MISLSQDQQEARDIIHSRLRSGQRFITLAGAAGTGKTTILMKLLEDFNDSARPVTLLAPTAKAALRMAEVTKRPAGTVHRSLYAKVIDADEEEGEGDVDRLAQALTMATSGGRRSNLRFFEPHSVVGPGELAIIDEASMIGSRVHNDIAATLDRGAQVLYLGDHAQLPPVKDTWGANLLNPDALLTRVHRQALDNPILAYATAVREHWGDRWLRDHYNPEDYRLQIIRGTRADTVRYQVEVEDQGWSDAVMITWKNEDRRALNATYREARQFQGPISAGDRVRVRENSEALGYVNGEVREVESVAYEQRPTPTGQQVYRVGFRGGATQVCLVPQLFEDEISWRAMQQARRMQPRRQKDRRPYLEATYGHCLTAHTSQGSQFDVVHVYIDGAFANMWRRDGKSAAPILYTAATRAVKMLRIIACVQ